MQGTREPSSDLAEKVLPAPLLRALRHIFGQGIAGCGLVGGTALSGYYAGHRRSDDLDLFTRDDIAQRAASLAVNSLEMIGADKLEASSNSLQYSRSVWKLEDHRFTVDVVLDANLFRIGRFVTLSDLVCVADLTTLLKTKAATLVSRCSEKDLYDLLWLFREFADLDFGKLIELGREIDGGVTGEAILIAVSGASIREEACDWILDPAIGRRLACKRLVSFRRKLVQGVTAHIRKQSVPELGKLVRELEAMEKRKSL